MCWQTPYELPHLVLKFWCLCSAIVQVLDVKYTFEASLRKLYAFHRRPEPQYRILLSEFWMCLDFNGFVAHTCSQAPPSWPPIQRQLSNQNLATWFKFLNNCILLNITRVVVLPWLANSIFQISGSDELWLHTASSAANLQTLKFLPHVYLCLRY
jgi:hypothetical protein